MNAAGVSLLVLLGMWLLAAHGYYFGYGESEGGALGWMVFGNVVDIVRICLVFSFFYIVRKEYSAHSNTKTALWFAGIAAGMLTLSFVAETLAEYVRLDAHETEYSSYEEISSMDSWAYLLQTIAYYLSFVSGLLVVAIMCVYKTLSENRRLAGALIFASVVLALNHIQLRAPYYDGMSDLEALSKEFHDDSVAWFMVKKALYMGAMAYVFFTYARKDEVTYVADEKLSSSKIFALIASGLSFVLFFTDWVYTEKSYGSTSILLDGGYHLPGLSLGLVLIVAAVVALFTGRGRNTCGTLLITYVILLWVIILFVPNEYGIALVDIIDYDADFLTDESFKFGKLLWFTIFTSAGAIMLFDGGSKSASEPVTPSAENEEIARLKAEIETLKSQIEK